MTLFEEIAAEREYQDTMWGIDSDDKNTINDWSAFISRYLGRASYAANGPTQRQQMLKAAALAVAALESYDRNKGFPARHYD